MKKYNKRPYVRKKQRINLAKWILEHKEEMKLYKHEYYLAHKDKHKESILKYRKTEKYKAVHVTSNRNRRGLKSNGTGVTTKQWNEILRRYNFRCAYCGTQDNMTMDHVVPLSKGGKHSPSNVVPACACCNSKKCSNSNWKPKIFKRICER